MTFVTGPLARDAALREESYKRSVLDYLDLAFNQHKPEEAVAKYVGPEYIQHNPYAEDGTAGFIAFAKSFTGKVEVKQIFVDGNYVIARGMFGNDVATDIYRFENGKIVEHWDTVQPFVPADKSKNNNGMF